MSLDIQANQQRECVGKKKEVEGKNINEAMDYLIEFPLEEPDESSGSIKRIHEEEEISLASGLELALVLKRPRAPNTHEEETHDIIDKGLRYQRKKGSIPAEAREEDKRCGGETNQDTEMAEKAGLPMPPTLP